MSPPSEDFVELTTDRLRTELKQRRPLMAIVLAGTYLIDAAMKLILDLLSENPDGLTNTQVGLVTGLNPVIRKQNGYVTWTLLTYLVEQGRVLKVGKVYRLLS
jgi:hypothetical protein